jgi:biotin carboxyl carrier protein
MQIEINKDDRAAEIEILGQEGSIYKVSVDGRIFDIDLLMVEEGVWSVLKGGKSFTVETIPGDQPKKYFVNTYTNSYEVEIVDSESRYLRSRNEGAGADAGNQISVPMPGKIVSVLVKSGDTVKTGDTLVIVSAMKMESEYKAGRDGIVKDVFVNDGDTVDGGQVMVVLGDE